MESPNQICKLPEEALIEIFLFLQRNKNHSDLLNATLVCKRWNKVISRSVRLMDTLKLKMDFRRGEVFVNTKDFKLTRPYLHAKLKRNYLRRRINDPVISGFFKAIKSFLETSLITIEISCITIGLEDIKSLSQYKFLRSLKFLCCHWQTEEDENAIELFKFNSLRNLQLSDKSSTFILNFIECKELDNFKANGFICDKIAGNPKYIIKFLNRLNRCDEIDIEVLRWDFETQLQPKFLWNNLKLSCRRTDAKFSHVAVLSLEALCKASKTNSKSQIALENFHGDFSMRIMTPILKYCKEIDALYMIHTSVPRADTILVNLDRVQEVSIDDRSLIVNVDLFTRNLRNVTRFKIHPRSGGISLNERLPLLSIESELMIQPFFDQITELSLPIHYIYRMHDNQLEPNQFLKSTFKKLTTLNFMSFSTKSTSELDVMFKPFCSKHQNLTRLNIINSCMHLVGGTSSKITEWFDELKGTTIKTCNLMLDSRNLDAVINWRGDVRESEVEIFGRLLTEEENQFFI